MKPVVSLALLGLAFTTFGSAQDQPAAEKPQTLKERSGYAYGVIIGRQMKEGGIEIDETQFARALADIFAERKPVLSEDEIKATFTESREQAQKKMAEAGTKWLAENAKKEGIKTTESGLQYEVIEAGEGASPKATDKVTVHYTGMLLDGTKFDSSVDRGQPATFPLNGVIKGWTEGVQLMKPGAKYRFYIPQDLAYGERGSPPKIPPFSALIFDIELISVGQ